MSMYASYIREHRNDEIIETEHGFVTYRYLNEGKTVYIVDIFVMRDFRKTKEASNMADAVVEKAKALGAKELIGTVVPTAKNSTDSLKVLLAYGMELSHIAEGMVVFRKDI